MVDIEGWLVRPQIPGWGPMKTIRYPGLSLAERAELLGNRAGWLLLAELQAAHRGDLNGRIAADRHQPLNHSAIGRAIRLFRAPAARTECFIWMLDSQRIPAFRSAQNWAVI